MTDFIKLLEMLNAKIEKSDQKTIEKVFQDVPLIFSGSQLRAYTPSKIAEMRKFSAGIRNPFDLALFVKQAQFMVDFEDHYAPKGEYYGRYPVVYQVLSTDLLRSYFSWRTDVRQGKVIPNAIFCPYLYISELLNQVGCTTIDEGFEKLQKFIKDYERVDWQFHAIGSRLLSDYAVYYGIDLRSIENRLETSTNTDKISPVLNPKEYAPKKVLAALNEFSSYKLLSSRFTATYPIDVEYVAYHVYLEVVDGIIKKQKKSLVEFFLGKVFSNPYIMFNSFAFYELERHADVTRKINDLCSYECKNGKWFSNRFFLYVKNLEKISSLLKIIDDTMRRRYKFRFSLKSVKSSREILDIINKVIDAWFAQKNQAKQKNITIDVTKLQNIRETALRTQTSLLANTDSDMEPDEGLLSPPTQPVHKTENHKTELENPLNPIETEFLRALLQNKSYTAILKKKGILTSVIVDSINDKLFDQLGDTILVWAEDRPEPVDDYIQELKELVTL